MAPKARKKTPAVPARQHTSRAPRLPKYDAAAQPIWEIAEEIAASVPHSEWAKVPTDLSKNVHHYLHGAPKEE
jgi:ribosomal protein S30